MCKYIALSRLFTWASRWQAVVWLQRFVAPHLFYSAHQPTSVCVLGFPPLLPPLLSSLHLLQSRGRCSLRRVSRAQRPLETLAVLSALDLDPPLLARPSFSLVKEIIDICILPSVVGCTCRELCFIWGISVHLL